MAVAASKAQIFIGHANTFHDAAIAIVSDGVAYAESLERHTQLKRSVGGSLVDYSGRTLSRVFKQLGHERDVHVKFATPWGVPRKEIPAHTQEVQLLPDGVSAIRARMWPQVSMESVFVGSVLQVLIGETQNWGNLQEGLLEQRGITWDISGVEHHVAHAACGVFTSPFEECLIAVVDGYGQGTALSIFHYHDGEFELLARSPATTSLGLAYNYFTSKCGFSYVKGEAWKVMGLAGYGKLLPKLYDYLMSLMTVDGLTVLFDPEFCKASRGIGRPSQRIEELAGGFRQPGHSHVLASADLAHTWQRAFEDVLLQLLKNLADTGRSKNLILSGGCALNSSASGKVIERTRFERLHVPSAPADDGTALGAALYAQHLAKNGSTPRIESPYLGSPIDMARIEHILSINPMPHTRHTDDGALCEHVAELLARKKIVGWMQGRAEFGPRALGNRSILADPRPKDMKLLINQKVKFREEYRPIAPSILHEYGEEYFENYQWSPYMERTLMFREQVKDRVPAVVHEDGTGRLQSVSRASNPLYYELLERFRRRSGVPILVNTSFNVMDKPIIHSVVDAFTVYTTTGLDCLVIGPYVFEKG